MKNGAAIANCDFQSFRFCRTGIEIICLETTGKKMQITRSKGSGAIPDLSGTDMAEESN
jgi:hypothetical protein